MTTPELVPTPLRDSARSLLIAHAIEIFGRDGFHAASTRAIAEAAGVNISQISYYFGGKEGLYLAIFREIASDMEEQLGSVAMPIMARVASDTAPDVAWAVDAVCLIATKMVEILMSENSAQWARLIVREQQDPTKAFDLLFDGVMGRVFNALVMLIKCIRQDDELTCRVIAMGIVGHAITFRSARAAVCRVFGQDSFSAEDVAAIQKVVRRNVMAMLLFETTAQGVDVSWPTSTALEQGDQA